MTVYNPKLLDLCCGFGGWSIGFHRAGFQCVGVDTLDIMYPYELIIGDVCSWNTTEKYDVIVASPPCTEFSQLTRLAVARGQRGEVDIEKGLDIVRGCKRIIDEVKPRFWIMENVWGAVDHISKILGPPKIIRRPWFLWGEFPAFLLPQNPKAMKKIDTRVSVESYRAHQHDRLNSVMAFNPLRSWFRAKIPLPLSVPLGEACRVELERERSV